MFARCECIAWDNNHYLTNDIELNWFLDTGPIDGHTADIHAFIRQLDGGYCGGYIFAIA